MVSSLCFWWILDGSRHQRSCETQKCHIAYISWCPTSINSNTLMCCLETEKLSFLKACLLISAKNYFLLDFHRELANYRKIQISPLTNLHQFFFFFNFLFQFWHIFGQASKENVGSTYISLLNPNYWGLLDGLASSFWSSNISENFGIWRRKSVTPCWSKKNYFSGKIDGKP